MTMQGNSRTCLHSRAARSSPRASTVTVTRASSRRARVVSQAVSSSDLVVGFTTPEQYFPAADLHTACFHEPCKSPNDRLWHVFDRIWGLQVNASLARRGAGRCILLIAFDPAKAPAGAVDKAVAAAAAAAEAAAAAAAKQQQSSSNGTISSRSSSSSSDSALATAPATVASDFPVPEDFAFPRYGYWLSRLVDRSVWPGLGNTHGNLGIVGVAQVDTFGDIIPPKTLSAQRDGAFGWVQREGYAYISNVAVSPSAQRCGVATRLMAEAEAVAASWGCSKAGLHVNMTNTPAVGLYRSLSYKKGALEAPWMPYLQGRAPDRCMLMLKRLPRSNKQEQEQEQQQQQQQQAEALVASSSSSSSSSSDGLGQQGAAASAVAL